MTDAVEQTWVIFKLDPPIDVEAGETVGIEVPLWVEGSDRD